jgi:hypothetical protein
MDPRRQFAIDAAGDRHWSSSVKRVSHARRIVADPVYPWSASSPDRFSIAWAIGRGDFLMLSSKHGSCQCHA